MKVSNPLLSDPIRVRTTFLSESYNNDVIQDLGRVFRPLLRRRRKMAALPLPVAILDDLNRKWGHPRWRPEAEGPPSCAAAAIGVEKPALYYLYSRVKDIWIPSNLYIYKQAHQIPKQSIEAWCLVENEDLVGTLPPGDIPTTSKRSTILLPDKVWLILEVLSWK